MDITSGNSTIGGDIRAGIFRAASPPASLTALPTLASRRREHCPAAIAMSASLPGSRELPASQYDLSTYWGRVRQSADIADPR